MIRRPPRSTRTHTLFPYPTLFRSGQLLSRFVGSNVQCSHRCATWHTLVRHDRAHFEPREQVRHSAPAIGIEPSTTPMLVSIVDHVAPLAERSQVARGAVGRIMVEVGAGDIDPRDTDDRHEVYRPDRKSTRLNSSH